MFKGTSKLRYIYNPHQAKFFMDQGLKVIQIGVHNKTGNRFWAFMNGVAVDAVHILWLNH